MTDKEIIKASKLIDKLRDAYNDYYDTSKSMPYDIDTTLRESAICLENALNEINRQQAEIERLKTRDERRKKLNYDEGIKELKSEAIKEFAVRLKADINKTWYYELENDIHNARALERVDELVKEMVGEQK